MVNARCEGARGTTESDSVRRSVRATWHHARGSRSSPRLVRAAGCLPQHRSAEPQPCGSPVAWSQGRSWADAVVPVDRRDGRVIRRIEARTGMPRLMTSNRGAARCGRGRRVSTSAPHRKVANAETVRSELGSAEGCASSSGSCPPVEGCPRPRGSRHEDRVDPELEAPSRVGPLCRPCHTPQSQASLRTLTYRSRTTVG